MKRRRKLLIMTTMTLADPLVEQLMAFDGKAEIVDGQLQEIMATGFNPGYAGDEIYSSLRAHARATGDGVAFADGKGFLCDLPNRQSFSPDAAFYTGPRSGMAFMPESPVFAVEVRSENDYSPTAERAMRAKIADYFAAGTLVVWDVDLQNEEVVAKYRADAQMYPQVFRRGEVVDAEPAVSGWQLPVDELFAPSIPTPTAS